MQRPLAFLFLTTIASACTPESKDRATARDAAEGTTTSGADTGTATDDTDTPGDDTATPDLGDPIETSVRNYIFGHSLILHSETANVPRWLASLSETAGYSYEMSGQYGFMDTHADNLPPFAQWGVPGVDALWDDDSGLAFSDLDVNVVLLTEANFRQYYPPTEPDPDGFLAESSVDSTVRVLDWVDAEEPGVRYLIYENWPDMSAFTSANFEDTWPTEAELAAYHANTRGDFHSWWLAYHDAVQAARPELHVRLVPVGSTLAHLLTTTLADVPVQDLYEDDAPHGQPTLFFLAGLVTYTAVYGALPPDDYPVPEDVSPVVTDRYDALVTAIAEHLLAFDDDSGTSRVF